MQSHQSESPHPPTYLPYLFRRFNSLIWSCLDADLHKSAVFYAERYFALDHGNHDARHLYATVMLRASQPHSALHLVNLPQDQRCNGCLEIKAKCCSTLGRHRQAREALEDILKNPADVPSLSQEQRPARIFPEEAILHCRSGLIALRGNLPDQSHSSLLRALSLNPMIWEAFEGLCSLGSVPEIEELFPSRPPPIKRTSPDEQLATKATQPPRPTATGMGFFTPDTGNAGNLFRRPEPVNALPVRMGRLGPRDSMLTDDTVSHLPEISLLQAHQRVKGAVMLTSRALSSADEGGPAPKKIRSTARGAEKETKSVASKSVAAADDVRSKKARARPALTLVNLFSSAGRRPPQSTATSSRHAPAAGSRSDRDGNAAAPGGGTRRSARLMGTGSRPPIPSKPPPVRDRRRPRTRTRSQSTDSDNELFPSGDVAHLQSPQSIAQSPRSDTSPAPSNWTASQEQAAQEAYEVELADQYIYDLMRLFASATRALAMYNTGLCMEELDKLPHVHQRSPYVMAMVGKAHYERTDYTSAERAFQAVYSTLLWHLQRTVQLSFLAQELVSIEPRSSQAWIAIGNTFSLQKERSQALTCFRRAQQLDPNCAYAFTLAGHEFIDEDLDKAMLSFQMALRADARHYNAWYGLGTCYLRKSKIRMAEYHYRKAAEIHPNNAVLLGCVGMLSPENALVRYRRAKMLISMKRYEAAVRDLEYLRDTSPEESNVIFQLARAYRLIGDEVKSAQMLAAARDISPKNAKKIQRLMETVKGEGLRDEEMDEG
ncbi:TPR-like protein [Russula earlei]|uniref:TPR-like protein n=1 Tax=Russula earlei TaxID=71964 RepID=A0ACC0UA16_9AGAM|nr:TPR-like protein [Russula earlei]